MQRPAQRTLNPDPLALGGGAASSSSDVRLVQAEGLGFKAVRRQCAELQRSCFVASEAVDIERESGLRGAVLLCALKRDEDVLLGYALLHRAPPATVAKLAVAPGSRRRGVGRQLLSAAVETARVSGLEQLTLQVDELNEPARRLYEAAGFAVSQRLEHYYCPRSRNCEEAVAAAGCRHALEMRVRLRCRECG